MICPSCNYERGIDDVAPDWQCPNCQVAYNKVMVKKTNTSPPDRRPQKSIIPCITQLMLRFFSWVKTYCIQLWEIMKHAYLHFCSRKQDSLPVTLLDANECRDISDNALNSSNQKQVGFSQANQSILSESQRRQLEEQWSVFGGNEPICPSCQIALIKFPSRKIKCKSCNKSINRGKNPLTNEYILFCDKQKRLYTELLWLSDGTWQRWFDDFDEIDSIRNHLCHVYKSPHTHIPFNDIIWAKVQKNLGFLSRSNQWYLYVRELETGIRFLDYEHNARAALPLIYQFIYLTYNVSSLSGTELERYSIIPKQIGTPQIFLIENLMKDLGNLEEFDNRYIDFINASGYPKIFLGTAQEALNQYKKEKKDYYDELFKSGRLVSLDHKFVSRLQSPK